jgi:FkbM family methyltransferase
VVRLAASLSGRALAVLRPVVFASRRVRQRIGRIVRPPIAWNGVHDPALLRFPPWTGVADGTHQYDFLGVKTDSRFRPQVRPDPPGPITTRYPAPHAGYFELAFLLDAVAAAADRPRFTVVELGAGYGYWLVVAHHARRRTSSGSIRLIGVEMVEQHVAWMRAHFENNGIDPSAHRIVHAAVSERDGTAWYRPEANPWLDYGQTVVGRSDHTGAAPRSAGLVRAPAVALDRLLREAGDVDVLHADLQGEEGRALGSAIDALGRSVARIVCATHSRRIHRDLRRRLSEAGWRVVDDFRCGKRERTRLGDVQFLDGLLTLVNPRRAGGAGA